jgi:carboxypeptidase C (cathepsin A)
MAVVLLTVASAAIAQEGGDAPPAPAHTRAAADGGTPRRDGQPPAPAPARTDSSTTTATWRGADTARDLAYSATAGYLPLKDDHDKVRANIFYVAYTADGGGVTTTRTAASAAVSTAPAAATTAGAAAAPRPIMFLFNGGPGAASVWLHLGAAGPKRLDVPADGRAPKAPYRVVDNEFSWLGATDLVFVDPVNTGYSRAATPEQAKEFFGVHEDIAAMGEFIRLYLTKNGRWGSPVFVGGESYGTTRAAGLADYLQERVGLAPSGIILISTVLNFGVLSPSEANDLPFSLYLPSYAAAAWYHKKAGVGKSLDAWLKDAEGFATGEYTSALAKGSALSGEDRGRVAARVAEFTGLRKEYILEANLRVYPQRFEKELLRSATGEGTQVVGRFDARITGFPTDAVNDSQEYDPSLSGFLPAYTAAFNDYVRRGLRYENDIAYEVLSNKAGPWNFGGGGTSGYLYVGDNLRDAMTHNPQLKVLVCSGRYDLATPYFATDYQMGHLALSPDVRKNVTTHYYDGGHMLYHVRPALEQLYKDINAFVESAR